jgi:hypothetical protein
MIKHKSAPNIRYYKNKGLALVTVIFMLVILSGAVVALAQLNQSNITQQNRELLVVRAENAALSGLEWAVHRLVSGEDCASDIEGTSISSHLNAAGNDVFSGFTITLSCTQRNYDLSVELLDISASASYGTGIDDPDYVWRKLSALIEL